MKTLKYYVVITLLFSGFTVEAQLLKKIGERAEKAAERTILNKTDQKTSQKVGKGIDEAVDGKPSKKKERKARRKKKYKNQQQPIIAAPKTAHPNANYQDTYTFTHLYKMKVSGVDMGVGTTLNYYLAPNVPYTGMEMNHQGMESFTIMNTKDEVIHSFINVNGNKIASTSSTRYDGEEDDDIADATNLMDFTITNLPNKTIAGHNCKGKQLKDNKQTIIFYYTQLKGISLNLFEGKQEQQVLPKELEGLFKGNNLIMYVEMIEKVGKKQQVKMECIELTPTNYTFKTKDYKSRF